METLSYDIISNEIGRYLEIEDFISFTDIHCEHIQYLNYKKHLQTMLSMKCDHVMKSGKRSGQKCGKSAINRKCCLHRK